MDISVADYFVEFFINKGITDIFGYQGGMIAYIFDAIGKHKDKIQYHPCCNEQAASFEACAWAQATGKCGVVISTSGPGFTNLLTGMANAWFDSIPVVFISGNVNTKDKKRDRSLRQDGFQEIQAVKIAQHIVKKVYEVELNSAYKEMLNDAYETAMSMRRGPVYIDLPINICRERVDDNIYVDSKISKEKNADEMVVNSIVEDIKHAKRPVIFAGAGIKQCGKEMDFKKLIHLLGIPVVTTLPAIDILPSGDKYNFGFIGATGGRTAGLILKNSDLIISMGTRLCSKQLGHNLSEFAPRAKLIRIDIDNSEFERKLKKDEIQLNFDLRPIIDSLFDIFYGFDNKKACYAKWLSQCCEIRELLSHHDLTCMNDLVNKITSKIPKKSNIIFDVGKNMTYCGQSTNIFEQTKIFMSAGLGSMGYSIPAAIGAYFGNKNLTFSFNGDGGALMNIQELNIIAKLHLPIKIIVFNNKSLGNIRLFQELYLDSRFVGTTELYGDYFSADFVKVAEGFGIKSFKLNKNADLDLVSLFHDDNPYLFEIEYTDCEVLPGIVACGDFINGGISLPDNVKQRLKNIVSDI